MDAEKPLYRRGDGTMSYFFEREVGECDALFLKGEGWECAGKTEVVKREMENRKEDWKKERKFVQGVYVLIS